MTLKEKFEKFFQAYGFKEVSEFLSNESQLIAEDFAIGFAEWLTTKPRYSNKESLEIYKKEKGL
jgi:hypothetical protein